MGLRNKYVILACAAGEHPVIFPNDPDGLIHKEVAWAAGVPVSAGFCEQTPDGWTCNGRSESLYLDSRGEKDEVLLNKFFPIYGEPLSTDALELAVTELEAVLDTRDYGFMDYVNAETPINKFRVECLKLEAAVKDMVKELKSRGVKYDLHKWDFMNRK